MRSKYGVAATISALFMLVAHSSAAGDVDRGEIVFKRCMSCHALDTEGSQEFGPTLHGIFGRTAGSLASYTLFSDAMKDSGIVWTEETLDAFLAQPKQTIAGNTMNFSALRKASDRAALIAYLREATR